MIRDKRDMHTLPLVVVVVAASVVAYGLFMLLAGALL